MTIVGEAEILVRANTAGFQKDLEAQTAPGLAGVEKNAGKAGEDAGLALSGGVKTGTKDLEKDLEATGKKAGGGMASGLKQMLGAAGVPSFLMNGYVALGVAAVGAGAGLFHMGSQMQETDTHIANATGQSLQSATKIGDAFLGTAMKSEYSGQQMAAAYAGVAAQLKTTEGHTLSQSEAMKVMTASTDLASASGSDLGTSTATLAKTMQAFGWSSDGAAQAADILYGSAKATGNSIDTVAGTFTKLRTKMGDAAPSLDQMGSLLVDITNHGVTGRGAVTALSSAVEGLAKPTLDTLAAQQQYGLSLYTNSGHLKDMGTVMGQISPVLKGMSQAQGEAWLSSIGLGTSAGQLWQTFRAGAPAYADAAKAANAVGQSHKAAEANAKTLHGTLKTLEAGLGDLGTKVGEAVVPMVNKLLLAFSSATQWIIKNWPTISAVITKVIDDVKPAFAFLISTLKDALKFVQGLVEFVVNIFQGKWGKAWDGIRKMVGAVLDQIKAMFKMLWEQIENLTGGAIGRVVGFFARLPGDIANAMGDLVSTIWHAITGSADWVWQHGIKPVIDFYLQLPGRIVSGFGNIIGTIFGGLLDAGSWIDTNVIDPVINTFAALPGKIGSVISGAADLVWRGIKDVINPVIRGMDTMIDGVNKAAGFLSFGAIPKIPDIPQLASGGFVPATPGGQIVRLAEGGEGEWVIPQSKMGGGSRGGKSVHIDNLTIVAQDDGTGQSYANALGAKLNLLMPGA